MRCIKRTLLILNFRTNKMYRNTCCSKCRENKCDLNTTKRQLHTNLTGQYLYNVSYEQDDECIVPQKQTNPQTFLYLSSQEKPMHLSGFYKGNLFMKTPLTERWPSSRSQFTDSTTTKKKPGNLLDKKIKRNKEPDRLRSSLDTPPETPSQKARKSREITGKQYADIINSFPGGMQMAFVYGSGAFQYFNSRHKSENILDICLVVNNPERWHKQNLDRNPHHYSFTIKTLGHRAIASLQENYGAGVYTNAVVPMCGRLVKYHVISTNRLYTDLLDWESLMVAGRLQKPVYFLLVPKNEKIITALKVNLRSAIHAACLLLPDGFTEEELYITIAGLSYYNVDVNKMVDLVRPNLSMFRRMYSPFLLEDEHLCWWPDEGVLEQSLTFHSRYHHLKQLPSQVLHNFLTRRYKIGYFPDLEEIIRRHAFESDCDETVARHIRGITQKSSLTQSFKNLITFRWTTAMKHSTNDIWWQMTAKKYKPPHPVG